MSTNITSNEPDTRVLPPPEPKRPSATKPIMVLLAVIGGLTLLVVMLTTIFSSAIGLNRGAATTTADATGATSLTVDAGASRFDVEFSDVDEATLETNGLSADRWNLTRQGTELTVEAPNLWTNWCIFNCSNNGTQVTLLLPEELNDGNLSADLDLSAGRLSATGDFDQLAFELGAGEASINGSARTLDAQLNAGSANVQLADVETAELEVSAGRLDTELTGSAPATVDAEVSAGRLDLTLPDVAYTVDSDISAGNLDNGLQTSSASDHRIGIQVSAGNATLRAGENPNGQ